MRVAVFSTGDEIVEPGTERPAPALYDANRLSAVRHAGAARGRGDRPRHPRRRSRCGREGDAARRQRRTIWCSPPAASRPARPITCAPPSRPSASWCSGGSASSPAARSPWASSTARRLPDCRAIRSRCSSPLRGSCGRCCCGLPVRCPSRWSRCRCGRLCLQEEGGPARIRARHVAQRRPMVLEAVKFPQDGAGVITSLTETDGLVELSEDTRTIEPGTTVGFLPYVDLDRVSLKPHAARHGVQRRTALAETHADGKGRSRRRRSPHDTRSR